MKEGINPGEQLMGTTEGYRTGSIVEGIRKAEMVLYKGAEVTSGDPAFEKIREKICAFRPVWVSTDEVIGLIRKSAVVAVGERVCRVLHPASPETQSVFLDELADALVEAGKAEIVTLEDAEQLIFRQQRQKFIASMVSGRYLELCAVHSPDCIFCKAERAGIRCFEQHMDSPL